MEVRSPPILNGRWASWISSIRQRHDSSGVSNKGMTLDMEHRTKRWHESMIVRLLANTPVSLRYYSLLIAPPRLLFSGQHGATKVHASFSRLSISFKPSTLLNISIQITLSVLYCPNCNPLYNIYSISHGVCGAIAFVCSLCCKPSASIDNCPHMFHTQSVLIVIALKPGISAGGS